MTFAVDLWGCQVRRAPPIDEASVNEQARKNRSKAIISPLDGSCAGTAKTCEIRSYSMYLTR